MYNRKDSYYKKAKKEGYKSRAAYKLLELSQKNQLIKKGHRVLDLGAAPGGWSQVALNLVGANGLVLAVDYAAIEGINAPNFVFIHGDMTAPDTIAAILAHAEKPAESTNGGFDVVLSDMAPKTTGIKLKDHADSIELAQLAAKTAASTLKAGGTFIVKLFDGEDRVQYVKDLQAQYKSVRTIRPDATRKSSYEMYVIATGFNSNS
ncbi:MAG: RlmE family RNA methyltransferase [Deferribacteraceae bacterium]|jgi:23S rRNA (uridine2552-2'-O)-methyltransferase|nr:RlmE family RNA methyltransferase [Deferribacteraceae bacterium]